MTVKKFIWLNLLILCCLPQVVYALQNQLTGVKVSNSADKQRIVLQFKQAINYKLFTLYKPERIVVDVKNTRLATKLKNLNQGLVKNTRSGVRNGKDLRLVFEIKQAIKPKAFTLKPQSSNPHRLVIDLNKKKQAAKKPIAQAKPKTSAKPKTQTKPKPKAIAKATPPLKLRDVIIVIDAGHGGKDPGATGRRGTREKQVVLAIARELQRLINQTSGMRAVLTRKGDYYIGLRQRLTVARKANADLFISIHADAFKNPRSRGASIFALSQRGATSEAARWLAEKENHSELGGVDLKDKGHVLRSVLIDLSQTAAISSSLQLGAGILNHLGKFATLHNNKVEQARFVVLKSPDIPSILVETGFISNPKEEANLRTNWYRKKLARAIHQGVKDYFWANAPRGTLIASVRRAKKHQVKSGDNLSIIASRYRISLQALKKANKLSSNKLRVGQVLVIPHQQT